MPHWLTGLPVLKENSTVAHQKLENAFLSRQAGTDECDPNGVYLKFPSTTKRSKFSVSKMYK